jgi:hypothetical protein
LYGESYGYVCTTRLSFPVQDVTAAWKGERCTYQRSWPDTHGELGGSVLGILCFRPNSDARAIVSNFLVLFYPEDSGRTLLRNVGTYRPGCTASHIRRNGHNNALITSDLTYLGHSSKYIGSMSSISADAFGTRCSAKASCDK